MRIATTRFGTIEIDDERVLAFSDGLIGFPESRRFVLLEHSEDNPFHWLQCVDDPNLALVVMDPLLLKPDFRKEIPKRSLQEIGLKKPQDAAVLTTVTICEDQRRITTNLLGPLVIHPETRKGKQVIMDGSDYSTKHDLIPPTLDQKEEASP
jgi:flagellar assembly factor FliW